MSPQKIRYTLPYRWLDKFRYLLDGFRRYPLRNRLSEGIRPFFIIGSGRSGNTLLRAILIAHGDLSIPPESYVFGATVREYNRYNFLPWHILSRLIISRFESHNQFHTWEISLQPVYRTALDLLASQRTLAHVIDLIYRHYADQKNPAARRWGDKTPLNTLRLEELELTFPQAQYVHMIRDGRDVVASYRQAGIYQEIELAAQRWRTSIERAQQLGKKIGQNRYLEVRYEALVTHPESVICQVCAFLGLEFRPQMMDYWKKSHHLGDTHLSHHASVKNPISPRSIGRWRKDLSPAELELVLTMIGSELRRLAYQDVE